MFQGGGGGGGGGVWSVRGLFRGIPGCPEGVPEMFRPCSCHWKTEVGSEAPGQIDE